MNKDSAKNTAAKAILDSVLESRFSGILYALIKLRIPELTLASPKTADEIAMLSNSHPESVERLLRICTAREIFTQSDAGYQLQPEAHCLLPNNEQSLTDIIIWIFERKRKVWDEVLYSIKTGKPAFDKVYGKALFAFLKDNPQDEKLFNSVMTQRTSLQIPAILKAFPFKNFPRIADIGGGKGHLTAAILEKHPEHTAILFDNSNIADKDINPALTKELQRRFTKISGDFFKPFQTEADLFILKEVLHDWPDEQATDIIRNTASNMKPDNRLLIIDYMRTDNDISSLLLDMSMLLTTGGKERSEQEFSMLLYKAKLELVKIYSTESDVKILECKPL